MTNATNSGKKQQAKNNAAVDNVKIVSKGLNIPRYKKIMMWAIIFIFILYVKIPQKYNYFFGGCGEATWIYLIITFVYCLSGIFYFLFLLLPEENTQKKSKQKIIYFTLMSVMYLILVYPSCFFAGMFEPIGFIPLLLSFYVAFSYTKKLRLYFPLFIIATMLIVMMMRFFKYW